MKNTELNTLASAVYGTRWQSPLSREMNIAIRTVQRWASDGIGKTATAEGVRQFLETRRRTLVAGPPAGTDPDQDRDDAVYEATRPSFEAVVASAIEAGWSPPEAVSALFNVSLDMMRDGSGIPATIETLRQAINGLKQMRDT